MEEFMVRTESKLLTEVELELMSILWRLQESTVRGILAELPEGRKLAYTSASTIIRILEQKGVVQSRKEGKAHVYSPLIAKKDYENRTLDHMIESVFDGTPTALVRRLLTSKLTSQEKQEIKRMIDEDL